MGKVKCKQCDRDFDSKEALGQHASDKHGQAAGQTITMKQSFPANRIVLISILVIAALGILSYSYFSGFFTYNGSPGKYDSFSKCLTEKNVTMYGSVWCPHCQNQKKLFGDSWKYVNYVECSVEGSPTAGENPECTAAGIAGYPTWVFNGEKRPGEQSLLSLSLWTGCPLE